MNQSKTQVKEIDEFVEGGEYSDDEEFEKLPVLAGNEEDDYDNDDDEDEDEDDDDDDDDDDDYGDKEEQDNAEEDKLSKSELDETNFVKSYSYKDSLLFNEDLEENDSYKFLQKFDKESKEDFIASNHQECFSKNLEEIKSLLNVVRDKNNIIVDELHKTLPILTKYEKTRILGIRLKQLNNGSKPFIKVAEDILDNFLIAEKELKEKKIPFIIQRPLPNNTFEYWKLEDLEIL